MWFAYSEKSGQPRDHLTLFMRTMRVRPPSLNSSRIIAVALLIQSARPPPLGLAPARGHGDSGEVQRSTATQVMKAGRSRSVRPRT